MLALALVAAVLIAAAITAQDTQAGLDVTAPADATPVELKEERAEDVQGEVPRDTDLQLYDRIAERVAAGENYYEVAVEEQRARDFPVRPGLAVRLPTLAHITAFVGQGGLIVLAIILGIATVTAWHFRLRDVQGGPGRLRYLLLLLVIGSVSGLKPQYLALHEVWAGMLIALSIGLYRPERWIWAVLAAALAVFIRELALPFILLMGAIALTRGKRAEAAAWGALVLVFGAALTMHLLAVGAVTTQADPASPGWLSLRGLGGWTANIVLSSPLYLLPPFIAAPLALLPLLGWAGWRSWFGLTGFLLCLGYGVLFMIAGRDNNFYWALIVMPVWFVGLAMVPRAFSSLWNSARGH
ncbi:hypothetical protein [Aurantiacibacter sediminis]|uniref:DUF2029 domain-containing protein n=1 Tax=Aurantiacibacter sediminis TaxID=2793064 RepID=A0ABS0MZC1_9SPHN|nr:hypothetical protein [Aurantiacibacter sediminis]MBH5321033.1 hypothetical protein [Aurantiacibacter sediminis]